MVKHRNWTDDEIQKAIALYLQTPFGRIHSGNPQIIELASQIARTPGAIALKLSNLASLDDSLDRKGMSNVSKADKRLWAEFISNPLNIIQADSMLPWNSKSSSEVTLEDTSSCAEGYDRAVISTQRQGQSLFRKTILTSYSQRCALTDIEDPRLLVASHIIGWAEKHETRLNPQNGICLNALHDRAFDRHLITFDHNYRLITSNRLPEASRAALENIKNKQMRMPERFLPSQDFLEVHRAKFFDVQAN
ncbi:MAG: HNH endonuclease [Rhodobacteraceae bacterium]|nr:HNH endonuclease [Paracoccaceae bacterium]